jgi:TatD DNase family protein
MPSPIFETHCHLNSHQFASDLDETLQRARAAGVMEMLIIGYDLESSRSAVKLANPEAGLFAAAGIHPHDAANWSAQTESELRRLLRQPGVVALGEIGLDYYRDLSPRDLQATCFRAQLALAGELRLPIVVHTRESMTPSLDVLDPFARGGVLGIMHCWHGSVEEARRARDLGLLLGVGGVVTYKKPGALPEVIADTPLESLVLETDSPYLPPVPHRGQRNEPGYLPLISRRVAEIKQVTPDDINQATRANARRLFGVKEGT